MRITMLGSNWTVGLVSLLLVAGGVRTFAQGDAKAAGAGTPAPSAIPGITDRTGDVAGGELLGEVFENAAAGIAFRPPAGCNHIRKMDADHVAEYVHDQKKWLLKVTRAQLGQPMALETVKLPAGGARGKPAEEKIGLLEFRIKDIQKDHPAAEVLRNDIVNVGEHPVGIAILRLNLGTQKFLRQHAIVQDNEQLYYEFNFTTPAGEGPAGSTDVEKVAVETFKQMIDTILILDRTKIKEDQVQRLFRTRALFTDWGSQGGKRLKDVVVPEQWLRVIRNGKDVGYSYVVEEFVTAGDRRNNARAWDGVLISVRSRTIDGGAQVDVGSQMFVSLDRKHEDFAHVANVVLNKGKPDENKQQASEYGSLEGYMTRRLDPNVKVNPEDEKAPRLREVEHRVLNISRPTRKGTMTKPEPHTPSPWYIPQAVGSMLPRLVPVQRPVTYLFQSYVSDERQVVHRYVDVGYEKEVVLGGKKVRAIPIRDRIKLEGSPTLHYVTPDGTTYLGSVNEEAKIAILPTDRATIERIWKDADLRKQEDIARPDPNAVGNGDAGLVPVPAGGRGR
jgi:hypothetical protein